MVKKYREAGGNNFIPEEQVLNIFTQICLAMKHCHDRKIMQRFKSLKYIFDAKWNSETWRFRYCKSVEFNCGKSSDNSGHSLLPQP
jgi:hypothetical protein